MHKEIWQKSNKSGNSETAQLNACPTIQHALELIHDIKDNNFSANVNVLFTGSLHLIGSTLTLLNSEIDAKRLKNPEESKRLRSV